MRARSAFATKLMAHRHRLALGREPEGISAPRDTICRQTVRLCFEHFGNSLQSVVLTGSLARDEATFVEEEERRRLLGDAEFLLIFHARSPLPSNVALSFLRQGIEGCLARLRIVGEVHLSAAHASYLSKLRPHIFAYELRNCGHVVCGDPHILMRIPDFSASDIPPEDGWRLICNRMIEQLEELEGLEQKPKMLPPRLFYRTIKLYLDMATSLVLFAGEYAPSYSERARRLRILAGNDSGDSKYPFDLRRFCERVDECTRWKLLGFGLHNSTFPPSESGAGFSWWEEAVAYARQLWRWELTLLTRATQQASSQELLERWMSSQAVSRRLRGWVYVLRKQGWHRSWRDWPRWARLARKASPRDWVYAEASEAFFRLPFLLKGKEQSPANDADWETMLRCLPVENHHGQDPRVLHKSSWQQVACAVVWNYQQFLEATRS
jgi:hypothetical protein